MGDDDDGDSDDDDEPDEDAIIIGSAVGFSGAEAPWAPLIDGGLQFAVQEINDDGGVLDGRELEVMTEDTESSPESAVSTYQQMADEGAVAVTGPALSDIAINLREEAEEREVPLLISQGSSPHVLSPDSQYSFRVGALGAPYYAQATADYLDELGVSSYGAIIADYSLGDSYLDGIEEFIVGKEGLEIQTETAPVGADDFSSQLRAMPDDMEFLDLGGHPPGFYSIVPQTWELGFEPEGISGPGDSTPAIYDSIGDDIDRGILQIHTSDPSDEEYIEVAERYYEATGEFFDPLAAVGYAAGELVAEALEDAGEADPQSVRDAISDIRLDTILSYPLEYTEWGELTEARLEVYELTLEEPPYYPGGDFYVDHLFQTETFEPLNPEDWE